MLNMFAMIGVETMALVVVAILVLFGGKKIPELMRGIGQGVGELKKGMEDGKQTLMNAAYHEEPKPQEAPRQEQDKVISSGSGSGTPS